MADPVQGATNSTGYFQNFIPAITYYGNRLVSALPSSEKLVSKTMGLGKLVIDTVGTIPGVGLGAAAVGGGVFLVVRCGKKAIAHYRDLDIGEGASWAGVLGNSVGVITGVGLVVIGSVSAVAGLQGQPSAVSSHPMAFNQTKSNITDAVLALNDTHSNITQPLKELFTPVLQRLPCLGETLKEIPKHFEANGSCFYIYP